VRRIVWIGASSGNGHLRRIRESEDEATFTFLGPVPGANSAAFEAVASLDTLANLYFVSTRSYSTLAFHSL
jgi:hypothetical protein